MHFLSPSSEALLLAAHPLATLNAALNATAGVLLVVGFVQIKRGRELAHRRTMLAAFGVSVAFLVSYLAYHVWPVGAAAVPFPGPPLVKPAYLAILLTHIVLAAAVPFMAVWTIYLGLTNRRAAHVRWSKWTLPIWLYVSVTGVLVYLMLYQLWPPLAGGDMVR